jgi:hypothetical protein
MLKEEIKLVQEIALIASKTATMTAMNDVMAKIVALGKRIDKLELAKYEPESEPVTKKGKKEAE